MGKYDAERAALKQTAPAASANNSVSKYAEERQQINSQAVSASVPGMLFEKNAKQIAQANRPGPTLANLNLLQQEQANPVIGENLFLVNQWPIRQNDTLLTKGLKGLGNFGLSAFSAPTELVRHLAIGGSNLLTGQGLKEIPKNTSFIGDILPQGAAEKLQQFQQSHPVIGGITNSLIETAADPMSYISGGTIGKLIRPQSAIESLALKTGKEMAERPISRVENVAVSSGPLTGEPVIPSSLKERGFSRNVRTDEYMNPQIRTDFTGNPATYEQLANKETLAKAEARFSKGYEKALDEWNGSLDTFRADDVPLSRLLANEAAKRNDLPTARKIIDDVAEKLTQAGQFSQAARILRQANDPGAFILSFQKRINKLNQQGRKIYGKKWTDINLTDDELQDIFGNWNKLDDAGKEKLTEDIYNRISSQIPVSKLEKYDSWRRIAMLLNPKTHERNLIGNVIMMVTRKTSDTIAAALEKLARVPAGERTKFFGWSRNKAIREIVDKEWNAAKKDLTSISRWDLENLRLTNIDKRIFKGNALNWLDELSKNTLNMEDNVFLERAYKDALGQYLSANHLSEVTAKAQEYARRRALEATFKQANILSKTIQNLKKSGGIIGKGVDIVIPFSLTPSNIVARAVEYSPLGIMKALYSKQTGKSAAMVVEDLAKGMTGSGVAVLGFVMAAAGWVRGKSSNSKNVEGLLGQLGEQPYSLITPIGSYALDWALPISVPFFMGVAVYEALQKEKPTVADTVINALSGGADTIFNMTMLQNIKDLLGGAYGSVSEALMSLPADYLSQGMPTILGQIARTADETKRSSYNPDPIKQLANTFAQKIPGLSTTLEPNLDVFGKEQSQGGPLKQFLSPGTLKGASNDLVTKEIGRVYKSTGESGILPKTAPRKITNKGQEIILTPKQITDFQRKMGQLNYTAIQKLISSPAYRNQKDENKAQILRKVVEDNYDKAKGELFKYNRTQFFGKAQ